MNANPFACRQDVSVGFSIDISHRLQLRVLRGKDGMCRSTFRIALVSVAFERAAFFEDAQVNKNRSCPKLLHIAGFAACVLFALSGCAGLASLSDDSLDSHQPLAMVPINYTDRWAINMAVDRYGVGDINPLNNGGGAAACCYPGPGDWSKPVTIRWEWGTEVDPKTKAVLKPREPRSMVVHFPPGGPGKDDRYLCVILRDPATAELAFARSRTRCSAM
jgi:hypothetical protein